MIRERLVRGIKKRSTQKKKKLLVECALTLEKAIKVAIADETANRDVAELAKARSLRPSTSTGIHRVKRVSSHSVSKKETDSKRKSKCKHCGKRNYPLEKCKFISVTCQKCKKHIAPVCKISKRSGVHAMEKQESNPPHVSENQYCDVSSMCKISSGSESPTMVSVRIENIPICMELDTG